MRWILRIEKGSKNTVKKNHCNIHSPSLWKVLKYINVTSQPMALVNRLRLENLNTDTVRI